MSTVKIVGVIDSPITKEPYSNSYYCTLRKEKFTTSTANLIKLLTDKPATYTMMETRPVQ